MSENLPWDLQMLMFCFHDVSMFSEELFTHAIGKHLMVECAAIYKKGRTWKPYL